MTTTDKVCADCAAPISHRATRCPPCSLKRRRQLTREWLAQLRQDERRLAGPHLCRDCGQQIEGRTRSAKRCDRCRGRHDAKRSRVYIAQQKEKQAKLWQAVASVVADMREAIDRQRQAHIIARGNALAAPVPRPLATATPSVLRDVEQWARALDEALFLAPSVSPVESQKQDGQP